MLQKIETLNIEFLISDFWFGILDFAEGVQSQICPESVKDLYLGNGQRRAENGELLGIGFLFNRADVG